MAKIVVLLLSNPTDKPKVLTGLKFAKMASDSGELDDVKLVISAQAVGIFKDDTFRDAIAEANAALRVMVCQMNAQAAGVERDVETSGVPMAAVGKELIGMLKEGYEVVSF